MSSGGVVSGGVSDPRPAGTVLTLFLPWVESWHTAENVKTTLDALDWGVIVKLDVKVVRAVGGKREHKKVFVHYSSWNDDEVSCGVRGALEKMVGEGEKQPELKVYHNETHYWKVRVSRFEFKARVEESKVFKPRVEF
jgi:hypothetical protein